MSHEGSAGQARSPNAGYALRMSGEIRDWLADLRGSDQPTAAGVRLALSALMAKGPSLTAPLVVSTADAWPEALLDALDRSYQERLERLNAARQRAAYATTLVSGTRDEVAGRDRLVEACQRMQADVDAFRIRKEVLKARCTAAHCGLLIDQQQKETDEAITAARARLAEVTAQIEQELGIAGWPEGLMELRPSAPDAAGVRILFAIEPAGTALLIAVLDGPQAVRDNRGEAILLAADVLHRVRAGEALEATAHTYEDLPAFLWADAAWPS